MTDEEKNGEVVLKVCTDTEELERAIDKADKLIDKIAEAKTLVGELASAIADMNIDVTFIQP